MTSIEKLEIAALNLQAAIKTLAITPEEKRRAMDGEIKVGGQKTSQELQDGLYEIIEDYCYAYAGYDEETGERVGKMACDQKEELYAAVEAYVLENQTGTQQCFCKSYFDKYNELKNCTCGKCKFVITRTNYLK